MTARVARLQLPGKMWFIAVCEDCSWCGLSWPHRGWANDEQDWHDERSHALTRLGRDQ